MPACMARLLALLLPALFPSWRFFKAVQPSPRIEWRSATGDWRALHPLPQRLDWRATLTRLVWSPERNEALYLVTLSERLIVEGSAEAETAFLARILQAEIPEPLAELRLVFVYREGPKILREVLWEHRLPQQRAAA